MSSGSAPVGDPGAERDARRKAREESRGPRTDRPEVRKPSHRTRPDAQLVRGVAGAAIVAIAVAIAAFMSSHGSHGWLIGLVVSIVTLALAVAAARASSG